MNNPENNEPLLKDLEAPRYNVYYPVDLWNEILPGLHLGGTDDSDVVYEEVAGSRYEHKAFITPKHFDTVVTMYAYARPVDWFVKEFRFGIYDSDMKDFQTDELHDIVVAAHRDWKKGKRVLVRCQAGINRSGLVMALMLIREGYSADEAINLMRTKRGEAVLANKHFESWLKAVKVSEWREKQARAVAKTAPAKKAPAKKVA
jgi:protein-tyrosine phosphatase